MINLILCIWDNNRQNAVYLTLFVFHEASSLKVRTRRKSCVFFLFLLFFQLIKYSQRFRRGSGFFSSLTLAMIPQEFTSVGTHYFSVFPWAWVSLSAKTDRGRAAFSFWGAWPLPFMTCWSGTTQRQFDPRSPRWCTDAYFSFSVTYVAWQSGSGKWGGGGSIKHQNNDKYTRCLNEFILSAGDVFNTQKNLGF